MWIEKREKEQYSDCKCHGLRLVFYEGFSQEDVAEIKDFCRWLTKVYWFPIRCYILFVHTKNFRAEDGHTYYGIFYPNDECKRKTYPRVCVAAQADNSNDEDFRLFCIAHELTHYFQWYFLEDEEKSQRSREIMASRWANYIVWQYKNRNNKGML